MCLNELQKCNPALHIHAVTDPAFTTYGRVITDVDTDAILKVGAAMDLPAEGSAYVPSEPQFEALPLADAIADRFFGQMPTQIGFCWGHNNQLGAVEWHMSGEINIAVTPLVLILGHVYDIQENTISSEKLEAFYVPAGTVLEVFATTLHFCPCEVQKDGFRCVVALPAGTNTPYAKTPMSPVLFRTNKWLLAHVDNAPLIARGAVAGVTGENYVIRY